jgi:hypothetical protein
MHEPSAFLKHCWCFAIVSCHHVLVRDQTAYSLKPFTSWFSLKIPYFLETCEQVIVDAFSSKTLTANINKIILNQTITAQLYMTLTSVSFQIFLYKGVNRVWFNFGTPKDIWEKEANQGATYDATGQILHLASKVAEQ